MYIKRKAIGIFFVSVLLLAISGGQFYINAEEGRQGGHGNDAGHKEPPVRSAEKLSEHPLPEITTPKPPFSEGIFPCTSCHAGLEPNAQRRELGFHTDIVLVHSTKQRWCLDCHDAQDRDMLRLANGEHVPFTKSYMLCGQCHGPTFNEWKAGVHGKRTGSWEGKKEYRLCVHCHNPHSPRYKPLKPSPMPARPQDINKVLDTVGVTIENQTIYIPVYKK